MTNSKKLVKQRRYTRFRIPAFTAYTAVTHRWLRSATIGNITDISLGGLSFRHVVGKKESYKPTGFLDISLSDGSFCLKKITFEPVWDLPTNNETFVSIPTRRCGVQFGNLTNKQEFGLRSFIEAYTTAEPEG